MGGATHAERIPLLGRDVQQPRAETSEVSSSVSENSSEFQRLTSSIRRSSLYFFHSWRQQPKWSQALSVAYHALHLLIIVMLLVSPMMVRSITFSPSVVAHKLLPLVQDPTNPKGGADSATTLTTTVGIENLWSIHDAAFFLERGHSVVPVPIDASFLPLRRRRGGFSGRTSRKPTNASQDTTTSAPTRAPHTYITRRTALNLSEDREAVPSSWAPSPTAAAAAALNEGPTLSGRRQGPQSSVDSSDSIAHVIAALEASALYSSPVALGAYYYLYLLGGVLLLLATTHGAVTGHLSVLRLVVCLAEVLWGFHHAAHAFVIFTWLFLLSHWPTWSRWASHTTPPSSSWMAREAKFWDRGTPFVAIERSTGAATCRWFYGTGSSMRQEPLDVDVYLRPSGAVVGAISCGMALAFVLVWVACVACDGLRVAESLLGLRSLWEMEGTLRCPLCGEAVALPRASKKAASSPHHSHRGRWRRWLRWIFCSEDRRRPLGSLENRTASFHLATPAVGRRRSSALRHRCAKLTLTAAEMEEEAASSEEVEDDASSSSCSSSTEVGPPVPFETDAMAGAAGDLPSAPSTVVSGEEDEVEDSRRSSSPRRRSLKWEHRSDGDPSVLVEVGSEGAAALVLPPLLGRRGRQSSQNFAAPVTPDYGTARSRGRPTSATDGNAVHASPTAQTALPLENLAAAGSPATREARAEMYDADDEFRPGNVFMSVDTASWAAIITFGWINALLQFVRIHPGVLNKVENLPPLPAALVSLEQLYLPSWQMWVHRRRWYPHHISTTAEGHRRPTAEEALEEAWEEGRERGCAEDGGSATTDDDDEARTTGYTILQERRLPSSAKTFSPRRPATSLLDSIIGWAALPWRMTVVLWMKMCLYGNALSTLRQPARSFLPDQFFYRSSSEVWEAPLCAAMRIRYATREGAVCADPDVYAARLRPRRDVALFSLFLHHRSGRTFMFGALLVFLHEVLAIAVVFLVHALMWQQQQQQQPTLNADDSWSTNHLVGGLLVVTVLEIFCGQWSWAIVGRAAMEVRTTLQALVLEKVMVLPAAQQTFSEAEVMDLITTQSLRCAQAVLSLHLFWLYPLRIGWVAGTVALLLGWIPALTAVVLYVSLCAITTFLGHRARRHAQATAAAAAPRLSMLDTWLATMRQIKAMTMEPFLSRCMSARLETEGRMEEALAVVQATCTVALEGGVLLLPVAVLAAEALAQPDTTLGPDRLWPLVVAFAFLAAPLKETPTLLASVGMGYTALASVESFLRQSPDEFVGSWTDMGMEEAQSSRGTVQCPDACSFSRQDDNTQDTPRAVLLDISMHVYPGEHAVIQGPVGSGKTTMLLAMLGEMNRCVGPLSSMDGPPSSPTTIPTGLVSSPSERVRLANDPRRLPGSPGMKPRPWASPPPRLPPPSAQSEDHNSPLATSRASSSAATGGFVVFGTCVYCGEDPWLRRGSIKENILDGGRGATTNLRWYNRVVQACGLDEDFAALPAGAETVLGEDGAPLTLDQQVRVSLARAVFSKADIYLLDNLLAYVEEGHQSHLVAEVLHGLLRKKTVILATNVGLRAIQPHRVFTLTGEGRLREDTMRYDEVRPAAAAAGSSSPTTAGRPTTAQASSSIPSADARKGSGRQATTTTELPTLFAEEYGEVVETATCPPLPHTTTTTNTTDCANVVGTAAAAAAMDSAAAMAAPCLTCVRADIAGTIAARHRHRRQATNLRGLLSFMGRKTISWALLCILQQLLYLLVEVWFAFAMDHNPSGINLWWLAGVAAAVGLSGALMGFGRILFGVQLAYRPVHRLHEAVMAHLLYLPASYVDGEQESLTRRFHYDMEAAEWGLPVSVEVLLGCGCQIFVVLLFAMSIHPAIVLLVAIALRLSKSVVDEVYPLTASLRRMEGRASVEVVSLAREVYAGAIAIRSLSLQDRLREEFSHAMDEANAATVLLAAADRWADLRLRLIATTVVAVSAVLSLVAPHGPVALTPNLLLVASLALMRLGHVGFHMARHRGVLRGQWAALRGVKALLVIPREAAELQDEGLRSDWDPPFTTPTLEMETVSAAYHASLPLALRRVDFAVRRGERVAIDGRSGSGRTALLHLLLRLIDVASAERLVVGGRTITSVPLPVLRHRVFYAIPHIPFDVLTADEGLTWRRLLNALAQDPFATGPSLTTTTGGDHSPHLPVMEPNWWHALGLVGIADTIAAFGGLDSAVFVNGEPRLNPAQQQLLMIAIATLHPPLCLLLDEATEGADAVTTKLLRGALQLPMLQRTSLLLISRRHTQELLALCERTVAVRSGELLL